MTEQSNHSLYEALSALVDGEASELEVRRLLKAEDEELKARWDRHQLVGAAMRGELGAVAPAGFADRVSAALENEAVPAPRQRHPWWQRVGQVAVAASVAGAVLLGVQQYPGDTQQPAVAETSPVPETSEKENDVGRSQTVSLPAGYQPPSLPLARTVSQESGYEPASQPSREVIFVPVRVDSGQAPSEEIRAYLNELMRAHSGHAVRNSNQGVLPYARVSTDAEE
ncbi:sigma-E factor negative regulatory protein [Marinimicrobium locisalis]|uniref:sigma-E factor negative regulatory protein n=1 Tax=Marinimicrobium locisalis TaxID=546022 RepID=UPI0032218880